VAKESRVSEIVENKTTVTTERQQFACNLSSHVAF